MENIDVSEWSAEKRSALKVFLASYHSQSNESDTVDNNGDNEALPTGSDTRDVTDSGARTQDDDSSDTKNVDHCSPLDQLVDVATAKTVQKVEEGAESESHIASNASSNNVSGVEHPNENPNELGEKEESIENPNELGKKEEFETVSKVEEDAVTATDIASDTSNHNVSEAKISSKNPNKLDETKDRLSDQSNADGNDSNQDDHGVHPNTKTDALAKAPALPKNTGSTSEINLFGTLSESDSAAEEDDGPHDVPIPYSLVNGKWDYIMCDINNIKKHAENALIEVELRIQTCFYRRGQYQGDFVRLRKSRILKLFDQRVTNETKKKKEDKKWEKYQRDYQKELSKPLHLYLKKYGWVVFDVNTDKKKCAFMRLDCNAKWTVFFTGGSTSICLPVKQFRVDLKKKRKEKKIEIQYVSTFYRFNAKQIVDAVMNYDQHKANYDKAKNDEIAKHQQSLLRSKKRNRKKTNHFVNGQPNKKRRQSKSASGAKVKVEPQDEDPEMEAEITIILAELPKLPEAEKTKLINFIVSLRDRKTIANIHDWFIDEGHIKENVVDVAKKNNTKTQLDEFYNPEPGSKYWEKHWPKGKGGTGVYGVSYDPSRSQPNPFRLRMPDGKTYKKFPHKRAAANCASEIYPNVNDEE